MNTMYKGADFGPRTKQKGKTHLRDVENSTGEEHLRNRTYESDLKVWTPKAIKGSGGGQEQTESKEAIPRRRDGRPGKKGVRHSLSATPFQERWGRGLS